MKSVYLAGPITGVSGWRDAFASAANRVSALGVRVLSPVYLMPFNAELHKWSPFGEFGAEEVSFPVWGCVVQDRKRSPDGRLYAIPELVVYSGIVTEVRFVSTGLMVVRFEGGKELPLNARRGEECFYSLMLSLRGEPSWLDWMRPCVQMLSRCDGVVLLPGWEESRGARVEHDLAVGLGLPVAGLEEFIELGGELEWV